MTILQMECFVEAAKVLNFTKAADNLYISQQTMSRQIKALENELGIPLFNRTNTGVRLTAPGSILFHEWESLLERYRSSVDQAKDLFYGSKKQVRIGVSDMGKKVSSVTQTLLKFAEKYPDLEVEYEVGPYPQMRKDLDNGKIHIIITYGAEIVHEDELSSIRVNDTHFRVGIILSKKHPLSRKRNLNIEDIKDETIAVLSDTLSIDHKNRVQSWFLRHNITKPLNFKEFHSFYNLQIALATGKCVGVMYERVLDGMEDQLKFYPLADPDMDGADVRLAWKDGKYAMKAKNIAQLMELSN